ncbi:MAG: methionine--tRNA ligase [Fimbriimonas sp.]|nr:methionine--tRNA ligase [Fimbriimonas sp.]
MAKKYFITTPIYYVNSVPHIGTALTTLAADVTARYQKMRGREVFFLTGTDENGTKVKEAAEKAGKDPMAFVDEISAKFREIWPGLYIEFDDFIRTTEPRHFATVQEFFRILQSKGHIYSGTYEGWYDVGSETFFKETDLVDGKSPDGNEVRWVKEDNYFFRMSAFADQLLAHIEANPKFILPESRKNEVVSFIKQGLRDVCISRTNPGWGIPVPGDESQVVYVWFDALINYVAATGWPKPGWEAYWPAEVEWMGKDILTRFHATLWPAMLMGVGLPLPETLVGHSWLLMGGEKISKSKGNVVAPLDLAKELAERSGCSDAVAIDAVRYYMAAILPIETDAVFTNDEFDRKYNNDLANDLGNALNRSLAMSHKFVGGAIPDAAVEAQAVEAVALAKSRYEAAMADFRVNDAADAALGVVRFLNKYIDTRAPWALAKAGDPALPSVMRSMLTCLRAAEGLIRPIMPKTADEVASQLGLPALTDWDRIGDESSLPAGVALLQPKPIFPRLDLTKKDEPKKMEPTKTQTPTPKPALTPDEPAIEISIEEFAKVKLKVGRVLEAEPVEGSDKLVKLQVVIGSDRRQIVAGIRKNYTAEDLIGRQVIVCVNLKPAKLRGVESQGMLLAAIDTDGGAILLQPEREAPEGAGVR